MISTDYMVIDPPFRDPLARATLDNVGAVLRCEGDRLAAWSRTTDTIFYRLPGSETGVFIKRYHYPRWKQRIEGMMRGTFFKNTRARNEYRVLSLMRRLGIQAVRPIAFGERRVLHFCRSCFLITEAVPGAMSLVAFIRTFSRHPRSARARHVKLEILTSLAQQVRHMHEAGFVHRDLFWRNVLIRPMPDERFEFYFLDASVGRRIRIPQRRQDSIVHDIAAMGVLGPEFCSKADQLRFLLVYLDTPRLSPDDRLWLRRVQARSDRFRKTELLRLERGGVFDPPIRDFDLPGDASIRHGRSSTSIAKS
ncbi:MAG TPA: lipopolysaccharide kinase InaA family protein [Phycisphaerae bacterium]|nr:lipopolysaccharide kinase InaA family protein [Phycisphaerae bacterium]